MHISEASTTEILTVNSHRRSNWQRSIEKRHLPVVTPSGPATHLHGLCVSSLNIKFPQRSLAINMHH